MWGFTMPNSRWNKIACKSPVRTSFVDRLSRDFASISQVSSGAGTCTLTRSIVTTGYLAFDMKRCVSRWKGGESSWKARIGNYTFRYCGKRDQRTWIRKAYLGNDKTLPVSNTLQQCRRPGGYLGIPICGCPRNARPSLSRFTLSFHYLPATPWPNGRRTTCCSRTSTRISRELLPPPK